MKNNDQGQSLVEVMLVLLVVSIFLTALVSLAITSLRHAQFRRNYRQAEILVKRTLEESRKIRDEEGLATLWVECALSAEETYSNITYTIIRNCDNFLENSRFTLRVTVNWSDSTRQNNSISADTILSDRKLW